MDPLTISASIIALMQLSSAVIGYLSDVKDSHKEQQKILLEICDTIPMLNILKDQGQKAEDGDEWSSTLLLLSAADGPIQRFREALEWLEHKLAPVKGVKKVGKAIMWPFKKNEIQGILSTIERQKLLFSLARQHDHIALTEAIKRDVEAVHTKINVVSEGVAGLQCSEKHKEIREWLAGPDPSSNYNAALENRHGGTGSWLIENDVFRSWKQDPGSGSMIWLYGIPGCGKTILCSTILEHILQAYASTPNTAVLYFFFDFNNRDKQRHEIMMRSLLSQLSLHCVNVPPVLEELHSSCLNGNRKPNLDAVLKTFHQMTTAFENTFVVLDALDECNQRPELLANIEELISWDDTNLRVLVTSRKEKDIEDSISPLTKDEARVCIQSAVVNADICAYVHDQLQTNKKLQRWQCRRDVQEEIENTLVKEANGM